MGKPRVLITNDDGIDSHFLRALVEAHLELFDVTVAAPLGEKSWIGRALTREGEVHVTRSDIFPCPTWVLDGTPMDCVNIALGHLIPPEQQPHAVASGINLGFNAAMPFILSSGTIAGALEGAFRGLPALAFSHAIRFEEFESVRANHGKGSEELEASVRRAAKMSAQWTLEALNESTPAEAHSLTVHNINFPARITENSKVINTTPGLVETGCLFTPKTPNSFVFKFNHGDDKNTDMDTDRAVLKEGNISYSRLDFSRIGRTPKS